MDTLSSIEKMLAGLNRLGQTWQRQQKAYTWDVVVVIILKLEWQFCRFGFVTGASNGSVVLYCISPLSLSLSLLHGFLPSLPSLPKLPLYVFAAEFL